MFDDFNDDDDRNDDRNDDIHEDGFGFLDADTGPIGSSASTPDTEYPLFEHPRSTHFFQGHQDAEQHLLQLAQQKRMPQSFLIAGPEGIGKATLAWRLARYLLANPDTGEEEGGGLFGDALPPPPPATSLDIAPNHPVFRSVAAHANPDLLTIERELKDNGTLRTEVVVEQIREVNHFMHMKPSVDGGWRVVIIDDADTMNESAQNALLKILEEPPARAILLLVAHRQGRLLPTIFSRVQRLTMNRLSDEDCRMLLARHPEWAMLDRERQDLCLRLGNGAPGVILQLTALLANAGFDKLVGDLIAYDNNPLSVTHSLTELVGGIGAEDRFRMFQLLLTSLVRHAALLKHGAANVPAMPASLQPLLETLMVRHSNEGLVRLFDDLQDLFGKTTHQYLDRRNAAMEALALWRANQ